LAGAKIDFKCGAWPTSVNRGAVGRNAAKSLAAIHGGIRYSEFGQVFFLGFAILSVQFYLLYSMLLFFLCFIDISLEFTFLLLAKQHLVNLFFIVAINHC
jgi:hypothetical protein